MIGEPFDGIWNQFIAISGEIRIGQTTRRRLRQIVSAGSALVFICKPADTTAVQGLLITNFTPKNQ